MARSVGNALSDVNARRRASDAAPDGLGRFHDKFQLAPLVILGDGVAFLCRGEAALRRDAKLIEIGGGTLESHQKNLTKDLTKLMMQ